MDNNPEFWLVRHGVSTLGLQFRFSGLNDAPLAPEGVKQVKLTAQSLKARLQALALGAAPRIVTSPVRRALESANLIAEVLDLEGTSSVDAGLSEIDLGVWDGLTGDEVMERWPMEFKRWQRDDDAKAVGGESFRDSARRSYGAFERMIMDGAAPRLTIVVTHSNPIKALLGAATTGRHDFVVRHAYLDFAALSRFEYDAELHWSLNSWNEMG